ncbi:MAG: helix-turn-helix transcriptional regulator [Candidatus Gastranaerophilaceae bacterium]|jgi:transcriptional regulator with XRE-family HTH domain
MQDEFKKEREYISQLLGSLVKKLRKEKGKSINLISNEAELSKSIWANLEKGHKDPQFTTLWRIAEALDMPLSEIILVLESEIPEGWGFLDK